MIGCGHTEAIKGLVSRPCFLCEAAHIIYMNKLAPRKLTGSDGANVFAQVFEF